MKSNQWTETEDRLIVADYLAMLADQTRGLPINKSRTRRALMPQLNGRTEGSIEFKRCNVSAVLADLGLPYLKGYLPSAGANYQRRLLDIVRYAADCQATNALPATVAA